MLAVDAGGNDPVSEGFGACALHGRRRTATGEAFAREPGSTRKRERNGRNGRNRRNGSDGTDRGRGCE